MAKFKFKRSEQDTLIVVMGLSGTGKTYFISKAIKEPLKLGHGLESGQSLPKFYQATAQNTNL
jgi:hypothetical protein